MGAPPLACACAADTRRHSRAHPVMFCASSVIRRGASMTWAPPRTGVRDRVCDGDGGRCVATATSTPKTGRIPAAAAVVAKRAVPATVSRSVSASVVMPRSAARWTRTPGREEP